MLDQPLPIISNNDAAQAVKELAQPTVPSQDEEVLAYRDLPDALRAIDAIPSQGTSFTSAAIDAASGKFRYWHVEPLLNQAADLMDRGVRDRTEYNRLRAEWLKGRLERLEFSRILAIHDDETRNGFYELASKASNAEAKANEEVGASNHRASGNLDEPITADPNRYAQCAARLARVSAYDTYWSNHTVPYNGEKSYYEETTFSGDEFTASPYFENQKHPPAGTIKSEMVERQTLILQQRAYQTEQSTLHAQKSVFDGNATACATRGDSLNLRRDWDLLDIDFRKRRTSVGILIDYLKRLSMDMSGGAFNFQEQYVQVRTRFCRDFTDAYARLAVADRGLRAIYGYTGSLLPAIQTKADNYSPILDQCLLWTRDAIRFLVAFAQLDQNQCITVSVRPLIQHNLGQLAMDAYVQGKSSYFEVPFELPMEMFAPAQSHIRIRGICVWADHNDPNDCWSVLVRIPQRGICYLAQDADLVASPLDRRDVPPCRLGRVITRSSVRDPDIGGTTTLLNCSPLGDPGMPENDRQWRLRVEGKSLKGKLVNELNDLHLDILVAARVPGGV